MPALDPKSNAAVTFDYVTVRQPRFAFVNWNRKLK